MTDVPDINAWLAVDVLTRDGRINPYLVAWLKRHKVDHRVRIGRHGVCASRNASVGDFLANDVPRGVTHLLQLDDDMVPVDGTDAILDGDGRSLCYCGYTGQNGAVGHQGDNDLGAACLRMSSSLLAAIAAQWFGWMVSPDGRDLLECECHWFLRRARAAGYQPTMVGTIGHLVTMVAAPREDGGPRFCWPG